MLLGINLEYLATSPDLVSERQANSKYYTHMHQSRVTQCNSNFNVASECTVNNQDSNTGLASLDLGRHADGANCTIAKMTAYAANAQPDAHAGPH